MCTAQGAAEDGALVAVVMSAVCCIPLGSFGVDAVNAVDAHCYLMLLALLEAYIHATKPTSPVLKSLLRCAKFISGRAWNLLSLPFLGWVPVLPLKSPEFHWCLVLSEDLYILYAIVGKLRRGKLSQDPSWRHCFSWPYGMILAETCHVMSSCPWHEFPEDLASGHEDTPLLFVKVQAGINLEPSRTRIKLPRLTICQVGIFSRRMKPPFKPLALGSSELSSQKVAYWQSQDHSVIFCSLDLFRRKTCCGTLLFLVAFSALGVKESIFFWDPHNCFFLYCNWL